MHFMLAAAALCPSNATSCVQQQVLAGRTRNAKTRNAKLLRASKECTRQLRRASRPAAAAAGASLQQHLHGCRAYGSIAPPVHSPMASAASSSARSFSLLSSARSLRSSSSCGGAAHHGAAARQAVAHARHTACCCYGSCCCWEQPAACRVATLVSAHLLFEHEQRLVPLQQLLLLVQQRELLLSQLSADLAQAGEKREGREGAREREGVREGTNHTTHAHSSLHGCRPGPAACTTTSSASPPQVHAAARACCAAPAAAARPPQPAASWLPPPSAARCWE